MASRWPTPDAHGVPVTVVVPEGNSSDKNAIEGFGAELVVHGRDFQEAREHAIRLAVDTGCIWCRRSTVTWSPASRPTPPSCTSKPGPRRGLRAGRSGLRALRQHRCPRPARPPHRSRCCRGRGCPAYALFPSRAPGHNVEADTFVDGVATRVPDEGAVEAMSRGAARFVRVSDQATEQAMRCLWQTTHQMPEPAGAIALAGLTCGHRTHRRCRRSDHHDRRQLRP